MCGRYSFAKPDGIYERFGLGQVESELRPRYNIAPTQPVPVVIHQNGMNCLHMLRWGMIPHWAKDVSIGNKLINARIESLCKTATRLLLLAYGILGYHRQAKR